MEQLYRRTVASALGEVMVCCSDQGVRAIRLGAAPGESPAELRAAEANGQKAQGARWAHQAARELQEYLGGTRKRFTVPLDLRGTPFQQKVWQALREIPYGETRSYGQIARAVGSPRGARAVGMANHANAVAIVVPCHRVIAGDGSLGGYACGVRKKEQLLRLEKRG